MEGMFSDFPEEYLFGRFFQNVSECLRLMEATGTVAGGGPLLASVNRDVEWNINQFWFFADRRTLGTEGLMQWHEYFMMHAYALMGTDVTSSGDGVCFSFWKS